MPTYLSHEKNSSIHWAAYGVSLNHGDTKTTTFLIKSLVEKKFLYFATDVQFDNECERVFRLLDYWGVERLVKILL